MGVSEDEAGDPFACFDSSDDESDTEQAQTEALSDEQQVEENTRDPGNGVLAFHAGTEVALLHHVKTELAKKKNPKENESSGKQAIIHQAQTVLDLVDSYCLSRHWMMHVGPKKAYPLRNFISGSVMEYETQKDDKPFTIVELGTYCGYSSIFIAKTILEHRLGNRRQTSTIGGSSKGAAETSETDDDFSFHIYSVEVVEKFAAVAKELIQLAGMESYISILLIKEPDIIEAAAQKGKGQSSPLSSQLKRRLPVSKRNEDEAFAIDFLFVDHDKSLYLPNLQELEQSRMIRKGTHVAADNVIFAQIQDYRNHMAILADKGIVSTRLEDSLFVEYCQPELGQLESGESATETEKNTAAAQKDMMRDGIEFSVYLQNPLVITQE